MQTPTGRLPERRCVRGGHSETLVACIKNRPESDCSREARSKHTAHCDSSARGEVLLLPRGSERTWSQVWGALAQKSGGFRGDTRAGAARRVLGHHCRRSKWLCVPVGNFPDVAF